jgi:polysaccharide chain length determinant protein (PEP-CTERM system associated)
MIPGKRYNVEDYLRLAWRRKWYIFVPFVLIAAGTAVVAWRLPNRYRSETTILVVPQRVPSNFVESTVTSRIDERLHTLNEQILSRTNLEKIIRDFDLYRNERQTMIMEDVVQKMRGDIMINLPTEKEQKSSFKVSYVGGNPRVVMQVTERLASLFIDENLRDRERLAEGTDQFLEAQLLDARGRLIEQEKKLEQYRRKHAGELPSQVQSNLQVLQSAQLQVQAVVNSTAQDRDKQMVLQRLLADAIAEPAPVTGTSAAQQQNNGGVAATGTASQQLETARANLRALELRLTPQHPDVVKLQGTIKELERKAEQEALQQPLNGEGPVARVVTPAEAARNTRISGMQADIESLSRQIAQKQAEEQRLRNVISDYQARLAAVPTRESELTELTRDHETLLNLYTSLLAKKENARMAVNMERRQAGEQFRILDSARLPERPFSPNRPQLYAIGVAAGLVVGLALVFLLEYLDTSLRTDTDVVSLLTLPVLALIPAMVSTTERLRYRRRRRLISLSAVLVVLASGVLAAWLVLK